MTKQLSFTDIFDADASALLPDTMEAAVPVYRRLLEDHHAAMLAGDWTTTLALRNDAWRIVTKLNGGTHFGVLGDDEAPGRLLPRLTAAPTGTVPLWGQTGDFSITVRGMRVRIEQDGMFGIGSRDNFWLGFSTHAIDWTKPFLSPTGYRSFLTIRLPIAAGVTPDQLATRAILDHLTTECKGKLTAIESTYRPRTRSTRSAA